MNTYVTETTIRKLRESRKLTQSELANKIGVSSKMISKWETAKGLPDISLLQPLAQALGISITSATGTVCLRRKYHLSAPAQPGRSNYIRIPLQWSISC